MKHIFKTFLAIVCMGVFALAVPVSAKSMPSVVLFINGTLGDKSFFDSAQRGIVRLNSELGLKTHTVEAGHDPTKWKSSLIDLADSGDYDAIIVGTFTMVSLVEEVAAEFPEVNFVLFDGVVDYSKGLKNVQSLLFAQNQASYLAGVVAAKASKTGTLGFVGGMEIPVINDFLVGFKAGAESVNSNVKILTQYANNFGDPAIGKEIALAQYGQGADVVFAVAGGTGQGVLEAAAEQGKLAVGVDSDQAAIFADSNPKIAGSIVTSALKNVDNAIFDAVKRYVGGENIFGKIEAQGLATGGVGVVVDATTSKYISQDEIDAISADVVSGKISVPTAF